MNVSCNVPPPGLFDDDVMVISAWLTVSVYERPINAGVQILIISSTRYCTVLHYTIAFTVKKRSLVSRPSPAASRRLQYSKAGKALFPGPAQVSASDGKLGEGLGTRLQKMTCIET